MGRAQSLAGGEGERESVMRGGPAEWTTWRRQKCTKTIEEGDMVGQDCCIAQRELMGMLTTPRSIYRTRVLIIKMGTNS